MDIRDWEEYVNLCETFEILVKENEFFREDIENQSDEVKRAYVRSVFATFDFFIISFHDLLGKTLTLSLQQSFKIKEPGMKPVRKMLERKKQEFSEELKHVVKLWDSLIGTQATTLFERQEWERVVESRRIRNRLTHPKTPESLKISTDQLKTIQDAEDWLDDVWSEMIH